MRILQEGGSHETSDDIRERLKYQRPMREEPSSPRWNGVGFYMRKKQDTPNAEGFAITRGIHFLTSRLQSGQDFIIFMDSQRDYSRAFPDPARI